jgi:hypothetical protein
LPWYKARGVCAELLKLEPALWTFVEAPGVEPIQTVMVGQRVLGYDETLGVTGSYTVTAVWSHIDPVVVQVTLDGEQIETTPEHPFYTLNRLWLAARELEPGMWVRQANGGYGQVQSMVVVEQPQPMYNLTVETAHTYFVGHQRWLVHNSCDLGEAIKAQQSLGVNSGTRTKGIGASGNKYHSSWNPPSGYEQVSYDEINAVANEMGFTFKAAGGADWGIPGQYNARHVEVQAAVRGERWLAVDREMCVHCKRFMGAFEAHYGWSPTVVDPLGQAWPPITP